MGLYYLWIGFWGLINWKVSPLPSQSYSAPLSWAWSQSCWSPAPCLPSPTRSGSNAPAHHCQQMTEKLFLLLKPCPCERWGQARTHFQSTCPEFLQKPEERISQFSTRWPAAHLNQIKDAKFRLAAVNAEDKVESGIVTVDQLVIRPAWRLHNVYVAPIWQKGTINEMGDLLEILLPRSYKRCHLFWKQAEEKAKMSIPSARMVFNQIYKVRLQVGTKWT